MDTAFDSIKEQTDYIESLATDLSDQLEASGLGCVNSYVSKKLEGVKDEYTDTQVSSDLSCIRKAGEEVKRSYGEVLTLLNKADPPNKPWKEKIEDKERCGLVKAVAPTGECEWVHPEQKANFETGCSKLGKSASERPDSDASMKVCPLTCEVLGTT
eukprot:1293095-Prymnesium_polylepis.2